MNPFLKVSTYQFLRRWTLPWVWGVAVLLLTAGFYLAFWQAPLDYQQKETVRILYIHVPASWLALTIYVFMGLGAIAGFVWKSSLGFIYAGAAAPVGLAFTAISLATGAIWGKPMWGTWWVWDARLTSMFVLGLLYIGYMLFVQIARDEERGLRMASILLILGLVNVPIIKFSVEWWSTLHQARSLFRAGGPFIHPSFIKPLIVVGSGFSALAYGLVMLRVDILLMSYKVKRLMIMTARQAG
jgi:heme exporter protein C